MTVPPPASTATSFLPRRTRPGRVGALVAWLALVAALAQAQTPPLDAFLAPLDAHPSLIAARAGLDAARAQLDAAFDPVVLDASGGYSLITADEVDLDPTTPGVQGLPDGGGQISADLTFRPFVFGDVADLAEARRLALEGARLDYREVLTDLQARALSAAFEAELAAESLALSRQGEALALTALEATRTRFALGAATERELRDAEAGYREAQSFVADAAAGAELARLALSQLVGESDPPALGRATLEVPGGTPLAVARAQLGRLQAELGPRGSRRGLIPVVQAGYSWNIDDENTLGVSIESRTLQPRVSYDYQNPGRSTLPDSAINGTFQIGVSVSLSPGAFRALEASENELLAAEARLEAARDGAELQLASLRSALGRAERALALAELDVEDARLDLDEVQRREALGLDIPLETQRSAIRLTEASLDLQRARQDRLARTLDIYVFYAHPLLEVLP